MEWLAAPLGFARYLLTAFVMYGCFMVAERIRPVEPRQPLTHIWFNLRWYVVYSIVIVLMQALGIGLIVSALQKSLGAPFISLPIPQNIWTYGLLALSYFLITDFFYYWFHRWQHKVPFLWEQHKFHHSEVSLNVTSTRRVHWLEDPLIIIFLAIPMGLLFEFNGLALGILAFVEVLWLQFIHLNLRLNLRSLSSVVTGPQYHRIHHSFQPEHLDKNFSAFFPIWDIVFGTYHHPQKNEFPPTGLTTGENYNTILEASNLPFKEWIGPHYLGRYFRKSLKH
ncbi:sterol desaturase family protein [Oscillatoria sp. CS-180]|uniref:sterol desaturase family protein n=1 Tax=Oscillatoria sp. CS-180 TaxID=3021720 RepID=UPI00232DD8CB|nr:sterol desaturase family protein [Oscillatoria sp. CS-180]MDB9527378.1 sterol desaturase family protein [Oscillatoria sp. CS-180]